MPIALRSRSTVAILAVISLVAAGAFAMSRTGGDDDAGMAARVERGAFTVQVAVAGELRARDAVDIRPPANADRAGAYMLKIASIIPEGTVVKEGDVVAELDRSVLMTQLNNFNLSMQKASAVFEQAQLDTTLNLSKAREELRLAAVALEERRIGKEQAMYEAPSTRRQAEIDYEKAERALAQGEKDYKTRENQAKAKMREVSADVERNKMQLDLIKGVMDNFTIRAPGPGMLIYTRDYSGKKRAAGAQIYYGDGAVASLPDLSKMESTTYINEVDVRKIAVGQPVRISLDSDPGKRLTGKVVAVANVGEERPNSDAKVFEVKIEIAESDTTLRPGMTTGNNIEVLSLADALSVPLEAVMSDGSVTYVFRKDGSSVVKQEVVTGALNDTHAVVTRGLEEGDMVLLVPPVGHANLELRRLDGAAAGTSPPGADAPPASNVPVKPAAPAGRTTPPAAGRQSPAESGGKR
jgi:RND family efflux transporter MFP subunit